MVKGIGVAATVIAALTGIGTIVGWIASDSFDDAARTALSGAGIAAMVGAGLWSIVIVFWNPSREGPIVRAAAFVLMIGVPLVTVPQALNDPGHWSFLVVGPVAFALGLMVAIVWVAVQVRNDRRARRSCPDCAETIRSAARVCRHCGYRFAPPPERV